MAADVSRPNFAKGYEAIRYSVDLMTAVLLLTGQISTVGLYIIEKGFFLSASGPILGGERVQGTTEAAAVTLDVVDIIAGFLLIIDAIRVTGVYVTSGRIYMVFSGPIFGIPGVPAAVDPFAAPPVTKECRQLCNFVKKTMLDRL